MMVDRPRCISVKRIFQVLFDGKVGKNGHGPVESSQILLMALFKIGPVRSRGFSDAFANFTDCKTELN